MNKTKIEYLDYTWNPIAMKCTPVTEGCKNCWHLSWCNRFGNSQKTIELIDAYRGLEPIWKEDFASPKKPSIIGVQYMGDLFHQNVPYHYIQWVFDAIHKNPEHTFILLTKRPERAKKLLIDITANLHLGVSISTNDDLWMVDKLLEIPAAVRFVSVEPQLEYIDMSDYLQQTMLDDNLDWVIQGAETGPGKRPFDIRWAKDLQEKCCLDDVPFFFKQDGQGNNILNGKTYQEYPE